MALLESLSQRLAGRCQPQPADNDLDEDQASDCPDAFTRSVIRRQLDDFPFQGKYLQPVVSSDYQPVVAPPHLIIRLFLDEFLQNINYRIPIFNETSLREAVELYYSGNTHALGLSGEHSADSAWAVIFTNIVLLGLSLETQTTRWQRSLAASSLASSNLLHEELVSSLFRNCDRALAEVTSYTRPSLLHVQALLTLVSNYCLQSWPAFL